MAFDNDPSTVNLSSFSQFITGIEPQCTAFSFVSLFSGAGISDYGLTLAGGKCLAACEIDPHRRKVHQSNIKAPLWSDIRKEREALLNSLSGTSPDLIIATPPCQSFSTANARRGLRDDPEHASRDHRNSLFFEALRVVNELRPYIVVFENVPNFLSRRIRSENGKVIGHVLDFMNAALVDYVGWSNIVCFSELGVPQRRKRALAIFTRRDLLKGYSLLRDEYPLSPDKWPNALSDIPNTILRALADLPSLDGATKTTAETVEDRLHCVPTYTPIHYRWIADIPPGSGCSAWENPCPQCGDINTPIFEVYCKSCDAAMINRPHVPLSDGRIRPINGFKTSYKRMPADEIASTITTASGHFSSDLKLHPTENRVLSIRECARLQTIPDTFLWPEAQYFKRGYLFREMIGEAIPPLVTYRLGLAMRNFLKAIWD